MIIQHNMSAFNSLRQTGINTSGAQKNLEKLSSGLRINRSADDAAGLGISEGMRGQIRGLSMAAQNANNGISLIQTAEGGLNETHALLQRMRELAVQSSNGTYIDNVDRESLDKELQALKNEVDRISSYTNYNGISLLDGSMGATKASSLPGALNTAPSASNAYNAGSVAALAAYLVGFGFPIDTNISSFGYSVDSGVMLDSYTSDFDGQSANLILTDGVPSLQVGDKVYTSIYHTSASQGNYDVNGTTVNVRKSYAFVDENNNLVSTLNVNYPSGGTIQGTQSGVLKNIAMGTTSQSPGYYILYPSGPAASTTALTSTDPMYNSFLKSGKGSLEFQIGANGTADQKVELPVGNMSSASLGDFAASQFNITGSVAGIKVNPREAANDAINTLDAAINQVSGTRADLGAMQNRLEHTVSSLGVTMENLTSAESTIRDLDMAKEMMNFTKNNILVQSSQSMLSQANQLPQSVLQLLK